MSTATDLRARADEFEALICAQATRLLEAAAAERLRALGAALAAFGVDAAPSVRYLGMWEDRERGLLPPAVEAELVLAAAGQSLALPFQVPVGAFHDNAKPEQIFELCMLRAEARQELEGGGDGHVLERMAELQEMITAGRVVFED